MATPTMANKTAGQQDAIPATEGQLVRKLRGERSLREFEDYLNQNIPAGMSGRTTHQSVWNWEYDIHPVTDGCLMAWRDVYSPKDARHQLAVDIVALRKESFRAHWVGDKGERS